MSSPFPDFIVHDGGPLLPHIWVRPNMVDECMQVYAERGLEGVEVDGHLLARVAAYRPRHVSIRGLDNDAQLQALYQMPWLEEIVGYSTGSYKPAIDWGAFPRLRWLRWDWSPKLRFPKEMPQLEYLSLLGMKLNPGEPTGLPALLPGLLSLQVGYFGRRSLIPTLPKAPSLTELSVFMGDTVDLSPLSAYSAVESVELGHLRMLTDLAPIAGLPKLSSLSLISCKRLEDLSPLAQSSHLDHLSVEGCKSIASLRWLDARRMKQVSLFDSNVVDGDMAPLIGVDDVRFNHRKHYSHRVEEIRAAHPGANDAEPALTRWSQGGLQFVLPADGQCEAELNINCTVTLWNMPGVTEESVPDAVVAFLHLADQWDRIARARMAGGHPEVRRYLGHHRAELMTSHGAPDLELASVGIWLTESGPQATLDYGVGGQSQYVLAVRIDVQLNVVDIAMES